MGVAVVVGYDHYTWFEALRGNRAIEPDSPIARSLLATEWLFRPPLLAGDDTRKTGARWL